MPGPVDPPTSLLDNPLWHSLQGRLRRFATVGERAAAFHPEVSVFSALPDDVDDADWGALAALHPPGTDTAVFRRTLRPPATWKVEVPFVGVQFVATPGIGRRDTEARELGELDVPEMMALTAATEPGPFRPRTPELGTYLGIRRAGRLVAMAGQRMHVEGHHEISAVCTEPEHRRQGLAARLVLDLVARIEAEGDVAFLHADVTNRGAVAMYEALGFTANGELHGAVLRSP